MDPRMRDYMMRQGGRGRDGRNPYGPEGGYVTSRRPSGRDRGMDVRRGDRASYYEGECEFQGMRDYARGGRGQSRDDRRADYGNYGYEDMRGGRDYESDYSDMRTRRRDYGDYNDYADYGDYGDLADYGGGYLDERELDMWKHKLHEEMEKSEREMLSDEKIIKRAKEMGIKFEKYTEDEFVVAVLAMYTDYCNTLGKANTDMYLKMAKDFLEDKDAGVKYGEKLAAYYWNIANV